MILNQLAVVKYQAWNHREGTSFFSASLQLYRQSGIVGFFKGIYATGIRDLVFGICYEGFRVGLRINYEKIVAKQPVVVIEPPRTTHKIIVCFLINFSAAAVATLASSPFNYVRSMQFYTASENNHPTNARILSCLGQLWKETCEYKSTVERISFLQQRLRIGWGTARVGVGMAFGQQVFDWCKRMLSS